jgi:hypothetical protein
MDEPTDPTQPTQPKEGEPIDIPVPTRKDVLGDLAKVARPERKSRKRRDGGSPSK